MWLVVLVVYLNEKPREVRPKYDRKILGCELLALRASALFHVYSSFACLRAPVSQASQRPDELPIDKDLLQHDGPHTQRETICSSTYFWTYAVIGLKKSIHLPPFPNDVPDAIPGHLRENWGAMLVQPSYLPLK